MEREQMNERLHEPTMSPRECAIDFVRVQFERGATVAQVAASQAGCWTHEYAAQIGGFLLGWDDLGLEQGFRLRPDELAITRIKLTKCLHRFDLEDLRQEIVSGYSQKGLDLGI